MSRYDDIINLPHHVSSNHRPMSMHDRAAQFAPFAALVGYDDAVAETARLTEARPELDEQEQRALNAKLCSLADRIYEHPEVRIKYYVPDERKAGGAIIEISGIAKKLSESDRSLTLDDGRVIPLADLIDICL